MTPALFLVYDDLMHKSELRLLLDEEFGALEQQMPDIEAHAREFWHHPDQPALSVWGQIPLVTEPPAPPDGTVTERELYRQLIYNVKPALAARKYGFHTVPVLHPHDLHYTGPPFRTHFLAVVMGEKYT